MTDYVRLDSENTSQQTSEFLIQGYQKAESLRDEINLQSKLIDTDSNYNISNNYDFYQFFLFVNPKSGGANQFDIAKSKIEKFNFQMNNQEYPSLKQNINVEFNICKLHSNQDQLKQKLKFIKECQNDRSKQIIIIIAGGDGTVNWIIEQIIQNCINTELCLISCLPLGTGNDLSQILGWGHKCRNNFLDNNQYILKKYIIKWVNAQQIYFDAWNVQVHLSPQGKIQEIKQKKKCEVNLNNNVYSKMMLNYFSVGLDARIGLGFAQNRLNSKCCNMLVYCLQGFKQCFQYNKPLNNVIENLLQIQDNQHQIMFQTDKKTSEKRVLKNEALSLVCVNINSYMGGKTDLWLKSQKNIGVRSQSTQDLTQFGAQQNYNDGILEFLTFNSKIELAIEALVNGQASRVAQGNGPFILNFKKKINFFVHLNIDGEYFKLYQPDHIILQSYPNILNGKIKLLKNTN